MNKNVFLPFILTLLLLSCNSREDLTTNTYSSSFANKSDKIEFLKNYHTPTLPYLDIEYHIVYYDNGSGRSVAGPSDWYMKFALKLEKSELEKRFENSTETLPFDLSAWSRILPKTDYWSMKGEKKFYENGTVWIVENDILLMEINTN